MMLSVTALVGATAGVLTILGLLAGAIVYFRGSSRKSSAELWRDEAAAQKARADRLETEVQSLAKRVDRLEAINEQLAQMASGAAAIVELRAHIDHQHAETVTLILATLNKEGIK